jgi:hypothetical protein
MAPGCPGFAGKTGYWTSPWVGLITPAQIQALLDPFGHTLPHARWTPILACLMTSLVTLLKFQPLPVPSLPGHNLGCASAVLGRALLGLLAALVRNLLCPLEMPSHALPRSPFVLRQGKTPRSRPVHAYRPPVHA